VERILWHSPWVLQLIKRPIDNVRAEAAEFRRAIAEAPEPELRWDLLGTRRMGAKIWWRLLHEHVEPAQLGVAVFVGVLIGLSPFYGFHVIAALACAMLFRLNKLAVWLATNVSFPILSPFFAFVSCQLGHLALHGEPIHMTLSALRETKMRDIFLYWLVGFPIQGVILGGVMGWMVYRVARRRKVRRPEPDEG
jgi:uncharacterized protein (DUF2062 family)